LSGKHGQKWDKLPTSEDVDEGDKSPTTNYRVIKSKEFSVKLRVLRVSVLNISKLIGGKTTRKST